MNLEKEASEYANKILNSPSTYLENNSDSIFKIIRQAYLDGYGEASRDRSANTDNELLAPSTE